MHVEGKTEASVLNNGFLIKTPLFLISNIGHTVILGTPFINMVTLYKTTHASRDFKSKHITLSFTFIEKAKTRYLNLINANSIY